MPKTPTPFLRLRKTLLPSPKRGGGQNTKYPPAAGQKGRQIARSSPRKGEANRSLFAQRRKNGGARKILPLFTQTEVGRQSPRPPKTTKNIFLPPSEKRGRQSPAKRQKQLLRAEARRRNHLPKFSCYRGGPCMALLGLNSMWNQTSGTISQVDRFKSRSSDQLCAPSVKLYVGLSSLSEIFLASRGMKLVISSVPPDMRFSRSRISVLRGQPAFPASLCHLGHMVIGVALAISISASEVIALIVHWSFLPCEIALKLHRFTCTLE